MAENASRRPVWVTIVAAVATIIVIGAIAAGPTALNCASSDDGFGACMRQQLADMGLVAQQPAPVSAPVETAEAEDEDSAASETAATVTPETEIAEEEGDQQSAAAPPDAGSSAEGEEAEEADTTDEADATDEGQAEAGAATEQSQASADASGNETAAEPADDEPTRTADVAEDAAPETSEPAQTATPQPEDPAQPTLGLVRAEPDGSLVIAGAAEPGATVEIYANDQLLGTTTTGSSGDWAFVPDTPLEPGGVAITVRVPEYDQVAEESVVVVIQDDRTTEPLVVASTPGEASDVIQGLVASDEAASGAEGESTETAAAESGTVPAAPDEETQVAEAESAVPAESSGAPDTMQTADASAVINQAAGATDGGDLAASAPDVAVEQDETADTEETVDVADAAGTQATAEPADSTASEGDAAATAEPEAPATDTADREQLPPPSIDAIEVDGERNFFAGGGPEGATIRLYVAGEHVGDTTVEDGRWLIETERNYLDDPSQRVRADLLRPGTADVAGRAAVNFEIDLPEAGDEPTAVADAAESAPSGDAMAAEAEETASAAAPAENVAEATDAPAEPASSEVEVAAAEEPASAPEDAAAEETQSEAASGTSPESGTMADQGVSNEPSEMTEPEMTAEVETPAGTEPEFVADVSDAGETGEGAGSTDVASAQEGDIPTMTAVQVGDPEDERFASGQAIIRRGDNLWTIARRVYGEGIRYTTIYQANRSQIRDPDLIYPGQVFNLPGDEESAAASDG